MPPHLPDHLIGTITKHLWPNTETSVYALSESARERHVHIIGQTGTGKSTLLENMIAQDAAAGHGFAVLDPHGPLAMAALAAIPPERTNAVIYIDPTDDRPVGFNLLSEATEETAPRIAAVMVESFVHIWGATSVGPASQDLLSNSLRALMDTQGSTLLGVLRLIEDADYRTAIAGRVKDPVVAAYWRQSVPRLEADRSWIDVTRPLSNKLRAVLSDPAARHLLAQSSSTFNLRKLMDDGGILIANLASHKLGEHITRLIGAVLTTAIATTAMGRDPDTNPRPFYFYAEELQTFANTAFAVLLSQSRKFNLRLIAAHQYLAQMPDTLLDALLGNAGTTIVFRLGSDDAPRIARHLTLDHQFAEADKKGDQQLVTLPDFSAFIKTLEDHEPVVWPLQPYDRLPRAKTRPDRVRNQSRNIFGRPRSDVERMVRHQYPLPDIM